MKELAKTYDPKGLEDRLYKKWEENGYFHAEVDRSKKPFTIVMPPPNITGQLHMGHALDNTMQDILIRYKSCTLCVGFKTASAKVCNSNRAKLEHSRRFVFYKMRDSWILKPD